MRTFPFGAFGSAMPKVTRRRKLGLSPIVTSASAPDFTKTLRSIKAPLKTAKTTPDYRTDCWLLTAPSSAFDLCPHSSLNQQSAMPLVLTPQSSIFSDVGIQVIPTPIPLSDQAQRAKEPHQALAPAVPLSSLHHSSVARRQPSSPQNQSSLNQSLPWVRKTTTTD